MLSAILLLAAVGMDSVGTPVAFTATGGTVTRTGLYTAGPTAGAFNVVAAAGAVAATASVRIVAPPAAASIATAGGGIPFGPFGAWDGASLKPEAERFSMGLGADNPRSLVGRIQTARAKRKKLLLALTGGHHDQYKTFGVFDMGKWRARMDSYNTAALRKAVAEAVADGTVIGNSVMDEPNNVSPDNSWGPPGTLTKSRVDEMCAYVKQIFPTLPAGVVHDYRVFDPEANYRECDFVVSQYQESKGSVTAYRDGGLAFGARTGVAMAFSLNILDGGTKMSGCPVPATGGRGTYGGNCRMRSDQVREYGLALGPAGCALAMWRFDAAFMSDPENQRAFGDVLSRLATLPARSCRRTAPPATP
jgi:hypothetical protein